MVVVCGGHWSLSPLWRTARASRTLTRGPHTLLTRPTHRAPKLVYTPSAFNAAVLRACPALQAPYACTPGLTNGHVETILVAKLRQPPGVQYKREILIMQDGGAVAIDWEHVDDEGKVCGGVLRSSAARRSAGSTAGSTRMSTGTHARMHACTPRYTRTLASHRYRMRRTCPKTPPCSCCSRG
jgi:hypothetical protein